MPTRSNGAGAPVIVSEFMASNATGILDEDGATSDWIELYNAGIASVNLAGWRLTDDAADLSKWIFPTTNLPPSGFLLVWASAKDRRVAGAPLHANFSLSSAGEYLALVRPDNSLATVFDPYPTQYDDISYGPLQQTDISQFIATNTTLKVYVPSNNTLGATWTATAFTDTSWQSGVNGVGYEQSVPGFSVKNFKANVLVGSLAAADTVIATPAQQTAVYSENRNVINYFNSGGVGNYGSDFPFPGFDLVTDIEDFVVEATGTVTIPTAGIWTFGVNSDDGFRLNVGSFSSSFPDPRGASDTLAQFNFAAPGDYSLRLVFYERGGGSALELFAAKGAQGAWNSTNFRLVGDTGSGGLAVRSLPTGQATGYRSFIKTDLLSAMYGKSADAYLRYAFNVSNPGSLSTLTLKAKYDDGFAAFLNGNLVASRQAPLTLAYNSVATAERPNAQAVTYETLDLSSSLGLLNTGNNVLAIQALNQTASDSDLLFLCELAEFRTQILTNNYFATSSPGTFNSTNIYRKVGDTHFSHDRGFYETNFNVTLTCLTPGANIRYTLDGTLPTLSNGTPYSTPILITKTSTVRAAAFKTGLTSSDVDTHTYLFVSDVITQSPTGAAPGAGWPAPRTSGGQIYDYGMDPDIVNNAAWKNEIKEDLKSIPTFSVVMNLKDLFDPSTGIYAVPSGDTIDWERPCSLELIQPDGSKGFHENCGIRVRGGFSRSTDNPKHAFRFFFRSEYGNAPLKYPVFGSKGANVFDKFDLRTTQNYSWAFQGDPGSIFLRDQFSRDTQLAMGNLGERGDWFHLYLNGVYWGLYNTDERAEASFGETYLGGVQDDYDTIKVGPDQGYTIYATDGNTDAWNRLWQAAVTGFSSDAAYYKIQGLNPDGTSNPAFENLLDVPNLIDYMLVIIYGGNLDAPISNFLGNSSPNNWFGIRDRTGAHGGFRFMSHDAEHTLLNVNEDRSGPFSAGDPTQGSDFSKSNPQYLYTRLWANAEFRILCADRIQKHFFNGGALTVSNAQLRLDTRTNEIFRALVPESARWGDAKRGSGTPITRDDWLSAYNNVRNSYLPARGTIVLSQLKGDGVFPNLRAPTFSQFGGLVPFGYNLTLANGNATGTIYYTLDGTDPRLRGGGINPTAAVYSLPIVLNTARTVRARIKDGTAWSAIVETTFYPLQSFDGLAISEIMYNPPGTALVLGDEFEFIELKNTTANSIDLSGLTFSDGVSFSFPNGTALGAGKFFVMVRNPAAFATRYPGVTVGGTFTGKLDNAGEQIRLKHTLGGTVFTVTYGDKAPWPVAPDGYGFSLVPISPNPTNNSDEGTNWRASAQVYGSPGADDPEPNIPHVLINEILAHTDLPEVDAIELYNPTASPANIGGWLISDDVGNLTKFRIPANTTLPAGGYKIFDETAFNADLTSSNSFRLSSIGDEVYLVSADAKTNLSGYSHGVVFPATQNGVSIGRYINSQGEEHFPMQISKTFGAVNSGPRIGPVVINEIQYNPPLGFDEFIELRNIASTNVTLFDPAASTNTWKISGLGYTFPQNVTLPAGGYLILSPIDPSAFRSKYGVPAAAQIFGPYLGSLQDSGERLELLRPDPPNTNLVPYLIVDAVRYNDKAPWPVVADGSGPSLQRLISNAYGDDPINWFVSGITPGKANLPNVAPVVSITRPTEGSIYAPPAIISIEANATDSDGTISKVEFYADGVKIGEDAIAPFSLVWSNAPSGSHTLTARAYDTGFSIAVSDPVQVAVNAPTPITAISKGSVWKYLDTGTAPSPTWIESSFNDVAWKSGPGQLGYGDDDEATLVEFGPDAANKYITTWFRRAFPITNPSRYLSLLVSVLRDDGAVVYLNGIEVFRSNMPNGTITPTTLASTTVGGTDETSVFYSASVSPALLKEGNNLLAVEIHQGGVASSDISFDLELSGTLSPLLPGVTLTSPANNSSYFAPATISLAANATDAENGISRVRFFRNATQLGEDLTPPYTFEWTSVPAGSYTLIAVAVNTLGLSRTSAPVNVIVKANLAPTVSLAAPSNNAVFVSPASVTLDAIAADEDGTVMKVEFFVDDASIGIDTSSPYSAAWSNPAPGPHVLKAIATDNLSVSTVSALVNVTITNIITKPLSLVPLGGAWKYHDLGIDLGTGWKARSFDDTAWKTGLAQLGYSPDEGDESTTLDYGPDSNNKYPTYYFRYTFRIGDPSAVTELALRFIRDDGMVAYLNGTEIVRDNMPSGTLGYASLAVVSIGSAAESAFTTNTVDHGLLVPGLNVLAVEIHQQVLTSSDLSFNAELYGTSTPLAPTIGIQPASGTNAPGTSTLLSVTASGSLPLTYQWRKGGVAIGDQTNLSLSLANLSTNDAGTFTVVIANASGSVTSSVATLTVAVPDSDGDGMPDAWEDLHGLNKNLASDAGQDPDGDGQTNLQEFLGGTDPKDPSSVLRLSVVPSTLGVLLRFNAAAGKAYTIQYRDSIDSPVWKRLSDVAAQPTGRGVEVADASGASRRFYRVVTPPVP